MTSSFTANADGSYTYPGPITFPASNDLNTGAGIIILGPNGGLTNFPAVAKGDPGLPPIITWQTVQVAYGTALPSPNPAVTVLDPGGPGVASQIQIINYVNAGPPGEDGTSVILSASDLEGTPANTKMIGYASADSKAQWRAVPCGGMYFNGGFAATTNAAVSLQTSGSITVPPQPFAWWPNIMAQAAVIGAVDTQINLVARLATTTGAIVGYGLGGAGTSQPPITAISQNSMGSTNLIAAGSSATIWLNGENQTASSNSWNLAAGAWIQVQVVGQPLQ